MNIHSGKTPFRFVGFRLDRADEALQTGDVITDLAAQCDRHTDADTWNRCEILEAPAFTAAVARNEQAVNRIEVMIQSLLILCCHDAADRD